MAESMLAYIPEITFFINRRFVQEHDKYKFSLKNKFSEN